jgi:c(7)-type cytochrome triheme protein
MTRANLRLMASNALSAAVILAWLLPVPAYAEYGDVVINNYSDKAGVRPVVFPHWFHRIRFTCKACHADLGIKFKAGGNDINMLKIIDGQYCGACHNGNVAWSIENCNLCHSGKPGTPTMVHESTTRTLVPSPAAGATAPVPAKPATAKAAPSPAPAPVEATSSKP